MTIYNPFGKRLFDIVASIGAVIALSPVMLATAFALRLEDGGQALYISERVGKNGELFRCLKFRSMPVDTESVPSASSDALTVTRVGRIIRRANIDEIPQLLNILKGDMSIVGPRPALVSQTQLLALRQANGAAERLPGLTGLAQVNSYDGMPEAEKAHFDGEYAKRVSFGTDLKIILRTFRYLTKPPPVY